MMNIDRDVLINGQGGCRKVCCAWVTNWGNSGVEG